jgi:hypothetical protein
MIECAGNASVGQIPWYCRQDGASTWWCFSNDYRFGKRLHFLEIQGVWIDSASFCM